MPIHVLVALSPKDATVWSELSAVLSELQENSRAEDGCQFYTVVDFKVEGRRTFRILEQWNSLAALDAHERTEHYVRLVPQLVALSTVEYLRKSITVVTETVTVPPSTTSDIYLVVYVQVTDKDAFCSYADELTTASRSEVGCLYYGHSPLSEETDDSSNWVFVEKWASQEALAAHRDAEHSKRLIPMLDTVSSVKLVEECREVQL